jgi:hypothetical protein
MGRLYPAVVLRARFKAAYYCHLNAHPPFQRALLGLYQDLDSLCARDPDNPHAEAIEEFRRQWPLPNDAGRDLQRSYAVDWRLMGATCLRSASLAGSGPTPFEVTLEPAWLSYVPFTETEADFRIRLEAALNAMRESALGQMVAIQAAAIASGWRQPGPRHQKVEDVDRLTWRAFRVLVCGDGPGAVLTAEQQRAEYADAAPSSPSAIGETVKRVAKALGIAPPTDPSVLQRKNR